MSMGYSREAAKAALEHAQNNFDAALDILIQQSSKMQEDESYNRAIAASLQQQPSMGLSNEEMQLSQAIEMSMKEQAIIPDFGNPEQQVRKDGIPVGLKNVGNTCYFNSLLQIYFMLPQFVKRIMEFKYEEEKKPEENKSKPSAPNPNSKDSVKKEEKKEEKKEDSKKNEKNRKKASVELVLNLQKLFSYLTSSNRKYVEPTDVLKALVDDYGNQISIGEQKDAGEFNIIFLSEINEALQLEEIKSNFPPPLSPSKSLIENSPRKSPSITRSQNLGIPNMLASMTQKLNNTFINENFFGEFQILTRAAEKDGKIVELEAEVPFGQIMINAMEKDIYEGWDTNYFNEIEGFLTPAGHTTKAEQEYWITKLPSVLLLQFQRVEFDKQTKNIKKITNPVNFEKIIYVDRFMKENHKESSTIRAEVREHKKKIKALESALRKYRSFGEHELNIAHVLQTATGFLENQSEGMSVETGMGIKLFDPVKIGMLGNTSADIKNAEKVLATYLEEVKKQTNLMEVQLKEYQTKVEHSYDHMKKYSYQLHSIIIHAGQADSGHYYAFIYDFEQNKWRKYNDIHITEVPEEEVLKTAIGEDKSVANAYCLIYVSKENEMRVSSPLVRQFSLSESKENMPAKPILPEKPKNDLYTLLIPPKLKSEVLADNLKLETEIAEYRAGQLVKRLQAIYTDRYEVLQQVKDQKPFEAFFPYFNFVCYLEHTKNPALSKWELLNECLKEIHENIGIDLLDKNDPIFIKLRDNFMKVCKNCPPTLTLSDPQRHTLEGYRKTYEAEVLNKNVQKYIFNTLISKNWVSAQHALCFFIANNIYTTGSIRKMMNDIVKMLSLRLISYINELIMDKKPEDAIKIINLLTQLCIFFIDKKDSHSEHAIKMLKFIHSESKSIFSESQKAEILECINDIENLNTNTKHIGCNPKEPPAEYKAEFEKMRENMFKWKESWKDPLPQPNELENSIRTFLLDNRAWHEIHTKIYSGKAQCSPEEFYEMEKKQGIDFKKGLIENAENK